ncbi:MAG TPA: hypothetical protein VE988_00165 [Gemmataceae bacterium]|nr:hypothetical protein [Gemmataceae bacterium]
MRSLGAFTLITIAALAGSFVDAGQQKALPPDQLPLIKELPDPFKFMDGSMVKTKADWDRRRVEIKKLFEEYEYGRMPPKPQKMTVKKGKRTTDEANKSFTQALEVVMEHNGKTITMNVTVTVPTGAKGKVPVLIQNGGFGGGKGGGKGNPIVNRGFAVASFSWNSVAQDNKRTGGIYTLFGGDIDTGTLMGWAWGISRCIDALQEAVPEVDTTKVFVTGHSRDGKATLVAGAFDERIALTIPSHSGAGGMPPYRFAEEFVNRMPAGKNKKTEQLHNIAGSFPSWFRPGFSKFGKDNVNRLPIDQHLLACLCAPRGFMDTEGTQDLWTNPEGALLSNLAARKVYKFLGAEDKISTSTREVGHVPSQPDVLDMADYIFNGKKPPAQIGKLWYKDDTKPFLSWDLPK